MKFDYTLPKENQTNKKKLQAEKLEIVVKPRPANSIMNCLSEESKRSLEKNRQKDCLKFAEEFARALFVRLPEPLKKELVFYFRMMETNNGGPRGRRRLINVITKVAFEKLVEIKRLEEKETGRRQDVCSEEYSS